LKKHGVVILILWLYFYSKLNGEVVVIIPLVTYDIDEIQVRRYFHVYHFQLLSYHEAIH